MDSLNILGGRLRDCIKKATFSNSGRVILRETYIYYWEEMNSPSRYPTCEGNGELPGKKKYLGGYYDKVKAMLPEGEPDKHYVTFVDFFSDIYGYLHQRVHPQELFPDIGHFGRICSGGGFL